MGARTHTIWAFARPYVLVSVVLALAAPLLMVPAPVSAQSSGWPINEDVAATDNPSEGIAVRGSGWGHSVGMSQYGARSQALSGRNASAILGHYYPGTALGSRNTDRPIRVGLDWQISESNVRLVNGSGSWFRCASDGSCSRIDGVTQSSGQTMTVRQTSGSQLQLRRGGSAQATVDVSGGAFVAFDHHGSTVEGPNPIHGRATYRHGRMEFAVADGALAVTQRVPNVELYLRGLAEMPASWPDAALQSQAIVGRTFALSRLGSMRSDCRCHLRASPADQAYTGWRYESDDHGSSWVAAVQASAGQVVAHAGQLAGTYYSSSHGGRTEAIEDSWAFGTTAVPYLPSVDDPWSIDAAAGNPYASWTATVPELRFRQLVSNRLQSINSIEILDRTDGGTPRTLRIVGADADGDRVSIDWPDGGKPAGARMRAQFGGTVLRSQQVNAIGVGLPNPFTDIAGSGHVPAIVFAAEAGITQGVTATTYEPVRPVTREQMASFIARTFDLPDGDVSEFADVNAGAAHANAIGSLTAAGITVGCDADNFCPREPVTREQMASFLSRSLGLPAAGSVPFDDVGANATHSGAIGALADEGITAGCDGNNYCPRDAVTRAQMATFLHRTVRSR